MVELMKGIPQGAGQRIPTDLIMALDFGKHPDACLRETLDSFEASQRASQRKAEALGQFKAALNQQLEERGLALPSTQDDIIVDD